MKQLSPGETLPPFFPLAANRVWRTYPGGRLLDAIAGAARAADGHFPEDWIASVTRAANIGREHLEQEGLSALRLQGRPVLLRDLLGRYPEQMLGRAHRQSYGPATCFLLKFLDSAIRLHIQIHPTIPFARRFLGSEHGKTEAYYILASRGEGEEAAVYFGFRRVPGREQLKAWVQEQRIDQILGLMHRVPVRPGEAFLVPGGIPHAIGAGILMIEVMEPTDFAVRLEFERGGYTLPEAARFMGRDLDFALDMLEYRAYSLEELKSTFFLAPRRIGAGGSAGSSSAAVCESLVDSRYSGCFRVKRYRTAAPLLLEEDSFFVVIVSRGSGLLRGGGSLPASERAGRQDRARYRAYDKFFVPFRPGRIEVIPEQDTELIVVQPPQPSGV